MSEQEYILKEFLDTYKASSQHTNGGFTGMTLGVVIDSDDPLQMGRLRVFCPALNDDPKLIQSLPWCVYASPFSGVINNNKFTRGVGDETSESSGAIHYGFWAVPELGAHVLVSCVDGDFRRRVWIACVPSHQETHTMHTGRWKWEDGEVDGPLTSSGKPIQPLYNNMKTAFNDEKNSPEWKSRAADYQISAIRDDYNQIPNSKKRDYVDQTNKSMLKNSPAEWEHEAIGAHGYDWTGFKGMGSYLSSRTVGFSSPGMHSFVMDDRPFNSRTKIKTATGHQIIMDDTNERIYISTNRGNNWVEMDSCGNIDVYSETRVSINALQDINLTAGGTIRMHADSGIHMFAGHAENPTGNEPVEYIPVRGEIRMESTSDISTVGKNIRTQSTENMYQEVGINSYGMVNGSKFTDVANDINVRTKTGDYIAAFAKDHLTTVGQNYKNMAYGTASNAALGTFEVLSFGETLSLGALKDTLVKAMSGDVEIHATGLDSGTGNVKVSTPQSQTITGDTGIHAGTNQDVTTQGSTIKMGSTSSPPLPQQPQQLGMFGSSGGQDSVIVLDQTGISMDAIVGDIKQHTLKNAHSYDKLVDKVDILVADVNTLTYHLGTITDIVSGAISALHGNMTIPITFNLSCLLDKLYDAMPQELKDAYATFDELNQALIDLGYAAQRMEDIVDYLESIPGLLGALGVPDIVFDVNYKMSGCGEFIEFDPDDINMGPFEPFEPKNFRALIKNIYDNGVQMGEVFNPDPTPLPIPNTTPLPP